MQTIHNYRLRTNYVYLPLNLLYRLQTLRQWTEDLQLFCKQLTSHHKCIQFIIYLYLQAKLQKASGLLNKANNSYSTEINTEPAAVSNSSCKTAILIICPWSQSVIALPKCCSQESISLTVNVTLSESFYAPIHYFQLFCLLSYSGIFQFSNFDLPTL